MKATVTKAFRGAPDGEVYPKQFVPGDIITGNLAAAMVREGYADDGRKPKKKGKASGGTASQAGRRLRKVTSKRSGTKVKSRPSMTATD